MLIGGVLNPGELLGGLRPRRVLVIVARLLEGTESEMGIIIPDASREQPEEGIVLAVGPGDVAEISGTPLTVQSAVGELVSFGKHSGQSKALRGGVEVLLMRDQEITCSDLTFDAVTDVVVHDQDWRKMHKRGVTCDFCPRPDAEDRLAALRQAAGLDPYTASAGDTPSILTP